MAEIFGTAVRRTNQPRYQTLESLLVAFDPKAFLLSSKNSTTSTLTSSQTSKSEEPMAESTAALQQNNQPRSHHVLESLSAALDLNAFLLSSNSTSTSLEKSNSVLGPPNASILPQNHSTSPLPESQEFTVSDFAVERGPRYRAYAELRESKLRRKHNMKMMKQNYSDEVPESTVTPPTKRVMFQGTVAGGTRNRTSAVARSVPDFSAVLRKENRKPSSSMLQMTPPLSSKTSKLSMVVPSKQGSSKSASAGEKKGGGVMMRKSYASVEELKGLSSAVASAINGESRGGKGNRGINRPVLGYRQY